MRPNGIPVHTPWICLPFKSCLPNIHTRMRDTTESEPPFVKPRRPKRRKRALSRNFDSSQASGHGIADSQVESTIFKLPPELRDQIWRECLGGLTIQLELYKGRIRQSHWGHPDCFKKFGLLLLPLTCRRIYLETISMLFGQNKIRLRMPECALYLDRVLLRERINEIRSLDFQWYVEEPPRSGSSAQKSWSKIWETIGSMESLYYARIEVYTISQSKPNWSRDESRLLEDVRAVTRPDRFELRLMWPQGPAAIQLPCEVLRIWCPS